MIDPRVNEFLLSNHRVLAGYLEQEITRTPTSEEALAYGAAHDMEAALGTEAAGMIGAPTLAEFWKGYGKPYTAAHHEWLAPQAELIDSLDEESLDVLSEALENQVQAFWQNVWAIAVPKLMGIWLTHIDRKPLPEPAETDDWN